MGANERTNRRNFTNHYLFPKVLSNAHFIQSHVRRRTSYSQQPTRQRELGTAAGVVFG